MIDCCLVIHVHVYSSTMADEDTKVKETSEKKKGSPLVMVLGAVLLLGVGAGGGWFYFNKTKAKETGAKQEAPKPEVKRIVKLEPFLVNLGDPSGESFLRVGIDLGVASEAAKGGKEGEEGGLTDSQIRDVILEILTKWTSDALLESDGKNKLKEQILKALQAKVPKMEALEIYFNDFLVQR